MKSASFPTPSAGRAVFPPRGMAVPLLRVPSGMGRDAWAALYPDIAFALLTFP